MGIVREERAAKILEETLSSWLENGQLPTQQELLEAYAQREKDHGDLTRSQLRQVSLPERFSESSASSFGQAIEGFSSDIDVLLRALLKVSELNLTSRGEWTSRASSLSARMEKLKSRIDSLLLMKSEAAGYVAFVDDGFSTLENVSSSTTANVDTGTREVTLGVDRTQAEGSVGGTQVDISSSHVSWNVIDGDIRYAVKPSGSALGNILSDKKGIWKTQAVARDSKGIRKTKLGRPITGELKVQLSGPMEISRVVLFMASANAGSHSVVACQYSTDGYTWPNVRDDTPTLSGDGSFSWRFPKTEMQFLKFVISKASPDETDAAGSLYDFGIRQVKVFSEQYEVVEGGAVLETELRTPKIAGSVVSFGRAALETCEDLPASTSIAYQLRSHNGTSYGDWVNISPKNRGGRESISVVDFTAPTDEDSDELTTTFDGSLDVGSLNILRTDGSGSLVYDFGGPEITSSNFYISGDGSNLTDLVFGRNVGYAAGKFPGVSTDLLVGDIPCGWGMQGEGAYYCSFYIKDPSGRVLDFGMSQAVIDGRSVSGSTRVSSGWHSFRTNKANWFSLTGTAPTTAAELKVLDPLYPYNHKYIIEGYNYPTNFNADSGVYVGADYYCRALGVRVGAYSLDGKPNDSPDYVIDSVSGSRACVFLRFDPSRPNHSNERIRLWYTVRSSAFTGIQLRATLKTEDAAVTPSLSYYRIMVK